MKQDIFFKKIQEKMGEGVIVKDGFLGNDKRNLIDILLEDSDTLNRIGITKEKIADALLEFKEAGLAGLGEIISYKENFEIKVETFRGKLPCPYGDKGVFQKSEIIVRNKRLNEELVYSDLTIHLIKEHGFFQGKGSPYRLDPEKIVNVLELKID